MALGPNSEDAYLRKFIRHLRNHKKVRWHEDRYRPILYRPGELLVVKGDAKRVEAKLKQKEYSFRPEPDGDFAGMVLFRTQDDANIPRIVTELRNPNEWKRDEKVPDVQPHHVALGHPNVMGGPFGPPEPADALGTPDRGRRDQGQGITVGVGDTGIWDQATAAHPDWLGGRFVPESDDVDRVYEYGDSIALQGGHGTFVAGVLRQAAPGVSFDPECALDEYGIGDERSVAAALAQLNSRGVSIINLSLGCFTLDDLPSLPLRAALDTLHRKTLVVASAGNAGLRRPSWPAAFEDVLGVAAVVEDVHLGPQPAPYSNHGEWVDACAYGERTSTYVKGRFEITGDPFLRYYQGFARWSGTSFAAPHVAGRIAAVMSKLPLDARAAADTLLKNRPPLHHDFGVMID